MFSEYYYNEETGALFTARSPEMAAYAKEHGFRLISEAEYERMTKAIGYVTFLVNSALGEL